jgi:hypothetical protein
MAESDQGTHYGNLLAYKYYMRPTAHKLYGSSSKSKIKHHENVQKLLQILFTNGICTTWEMAKIRFHNDVSAIRTKEKEYRRLLIGRIDRGKHSEGVLDLGLVVKDEYSVIKKISDQYRLSLHGILYCLDILDLSHKDIDKMASKYADVLPKIFGKWDFLKSNIGDDVYKLQILSKGLLLDNPAMKNPFNPIYELMSFIHIKYQRNYESISEKNLADQIAYWFYTFLLFQRPTSNKDKTQNGIKRLQNIIEKDVEIQKWYLEFFKEAENYYKQRFQTIKNSGIF